jgi:hypothetical protein
VPGIATQQGQSGAFWNGLCNCLLKTFLMKRLNRTFFLVTLFSIAMGFLETAVVVYLRKIYYPNGFAFPLTPIDREIAITELWRELATLIMLISIGALAGKTRAERFAYFLYSFAVWDICYYIFLKVFINWPESLFTWDILFLLPVPWVGPVIAPVITAATMILFAGTIIYFNRHMPVRLKGRESLILWLGAITTIVSFTYDFVHRKGAVLLGNVSGTHSLMADMVDYVPVSFNWYLYFLAEIAILIAYGMYAGRLVNTRKQSRPLTGSHSEDMLFH